MLTVAMVYRKNGPWFENFVYILACIEINFEIYGPEIKIHCEKKFVASADEVIRLLILKVWIWDIAHQNYQIFKVEFIWYFSS